MDSHRALGRLSEAEIAEICRADLGVLVLTRTASGRCDVYQADIERMMARGSLAGIPIGKLIVDELGPSSCWAQVVASADENSYPVTIIYRNGREIDQFCTTQATYLLKRIAAVSVDSLVKPLGPDPKEGDADDCD